MKQTDAGSQRIYHSLQYARGIAALMVATFHAILAFEKLPGDHIDWLPAMGACGVDIFFVLSGFVIWASTSGKAIGPAEFGLRRIARIVPLYWIVTVTLVSLAAIIPSAFKTYQFSLSHLLASLAFIPWRNPGILSGSFRDMMVPTLVPGWTLNHEMYFYVLFAIALFFPQRLRLGTLLIIVPVITLLCAALRGTSDILHVYGAPRVGEFLAGVMVAKWVEDGRTPPRRTLLWLLVPTAFLGLLTAERLGNNVLLLGAASTTMIFALVMLEMKRNFPRFPKLELLGDASYSLYLTHVFAIGLIRAASKQIPTKLMGSVAEEIMFVSACLLASIAFGIAVHLWIERPLTKFLRTKQRPATNHHKWTDIKKAPQNV